MGILEWSWCSALLAFALALAISGGWGVGEGAQANRGVGHMLLATGSLVLALMVAKDAILAPIWTHLYAHVHALQGGDIAWVTAVALWLVSVLGSCAVYLFAGMQIGERCQKVYSAARTHSTASQRTTAWKLAAVATVAGAALFWVALASLVVFLVWQHSVILALGGAMPLMFEGAARRSFAVVLWFWPEAATPGYLAKHQPLFNFSRTTRGMHAQETPCGQ